MSPRANNTTNRGVNDNRNAHFREILDRINLENPSPELFDTVAEKIAETLSHARGQRNKTTQLRRFYDEYSQYIEKIGSSQEKLDELMPFIRMLRAKAAYSKGRNLVDENFVDFIGTIVGHAKSPKSLRHGQTLFEAVMGFLKFYNK